MNKVFVHYPGGSVAPNTLLPNSNSDIVTLMFNSARIVSRSQRKVMDHVIPSAIPE